jgi:cell division protein FtsZ
MINVDFADVRTVMSEMGMAMMGTGSARGDNRATVAAQAAISSPLLEEINLSGARGILVNVTAGEDMLLSEFEEVGNAIREFASENATVVVGTVIDPEMDGELRVTVVATGLGGKPQAQVEPQPVKLVVNKPVVTAEVDYGQLDRPTVLRNQPDQSRAVKNHEGNLDYLDIPAFLRRQAD